MRVALDEQIFAIQAYGGISRLFYQKAKAFLNEQGLGVDLEPLRAAIVNEYVLGDQNLAAQLQVSRSGGPYRSLYSYFTRKRSQTSVDVVHNTFYLPRGLSEHRTSRRVVTIYDMIPELLPATRRRLDFLTQKHLYVRNADHIICISESTRKDLLRIYPDIQVPISIAYPGVSDAFHPNIPRQENFPEHYILHVGNRGGYKDAATLLRAFTSISPAFPDYVLLLIGGGPLTGEEREILSVNKIASEAVQQRTLADALVPSAYANATATVFPSRYEGFGLPAVEAMAAGSPLVLAKTSSLPEVGGDAAVYFPPGDHRALASCLSELLSDAAQQRDMTERGLQQAKGFTWRSYAQSNADAYRQVLD